jgi:hypothetical protein
VNKRRMVMALGGIGSALLLILAAPAPARATAKSGACPSWICGSVTWDDRMPDTGPITAFRFDYNFRDKTCTTGSNAQFTIRVWYTDGSSQYSRWATDANGCDAIPVVGTNRWFVAPTGKAISYFRAVFRDSDHTAGLLGNKADFMD